MLKVFTYRRIALTALLILLSLLLYNYPEEINEEVKINNGNRVPIYLIDENNFVAMSMIKQNNNDSIDKIKDIVKALTINSGKELNNGFKAVIPEHTVLKEVNLDNGMLKLNFSKEFLNVTIDMEEKMIEAIIYSLTEINEVKKIMIFVDSERLMELPNSKKKLDLYLDRNYGINKIINIDSIKDTQMTTVYYLAKNNDYYYIPISLVSNNEDNKINIIIKNLKSNTLNNSNLLSHLNYQVDLMNYEVNDREIRLNFNNVLLDSINNGQLQEEVKYAIAYSVRDSMNVENVIFLVNEEEIDKYSFK